MIRLEAIGDAVDIKTRDDARFNCLGHACRDSRLSSVCQELDREAQKHTIIIENEYSTKPHIRDIELRPHGDRAARSWARRLLRDAYGRGVWLNQCLRLLRAKRMAQPDDFLLDRYEAESKPGVYYEVMATIGLDSNMGGVEFHFMRKYHGGEWRGKPSQMDSRELPGQIDGDRHTGAILIFNDKQYVILGSLFVVPGPGVPRAPVRAAAKTSTGPSPFKQFLAAKAASSQREAAAASSQGDAADE